MTNYLLIKLYGVGYCAKIFSPVSLQRQTTHAACLETLGTWQLWICPGWDHKHICSSNTTVTVAVVSKTTALE